MAASVTFFIFATIFLSFNSCSTATEHVGGIQFTYRGDRGPYNWGNLSPKFDQCKNGKSQSPIDIVKHKAVINKKLKPLIRKYHSAVNVTLVNYGFTVGVRYPNKSGALMLDGKKYSLKQMHWHSPSEHRIDGVQFDAELHLVHIAEDHSVSVVGILYKYGRTDPIVAKIESKLIELGHHRTTQIKMGPFNPHQLRKRTHKYYRYVGSFTTPPCTEHVIWLILGKVRHISREQVEALQAPLDMGCKKNSRPVQPINGRHVELFKELH
ncbi:alpha carbonic anhydrase 1, chloroplastic [Olea europaea subsp. europaea]|uniref:Carbonic anhydrase n=1 Tax=Olea europaea subsp. europaea TaxID=158383 RepID=A0A8S0RCM0_OLEEU|nr:alpha carbonic anhydrase 1, chloroplastic [Olea europaea subsp. europaea]